jgi:hypothetical protein
MPIPAAFIKKGRKAAEGSAAEEKSESPEMEKGESPKYGDAPHGKMGKKPCAKCMKKGKKRGSCGCDKGGKMDAALTPMEYLDACDLGIQDRSKSYIRARLDAMATAGKGQGTKCGNGYIGRGKKCKSAGAGLASPNTGSTGRKVATGAGKALGFVGKVGQAVSTSLAVNNILKGNLNRANKLNAAAGGFGALQGVGNVVEGAATGNQMLRTRGNVRIGGGALIAGLGLRGAGVSGKDIKNAANRGKAALNNEMSVLKAKLAKRVNKVAGEAAVKKSNVTFKTKKSQFERLYKKP